MIAALLVIEIMGNASGQTVAPMPDMKTCMAARQAIIEEYHYDGIVFDITGKIKCLEVKK